MAKYYHKEGVWMWYDWTETVQAYFIDDDFAKVARKQAKSGYGKVGFWPFGMELREAVMWWEDRNDD